MLVQELPKPPVIADVSRLFHQLNNQLGIILANAELLEHRLTDDTHRQRAGQVVASALDAIHTVRHLRLAADPEVSSSGK
jgi:hypothetical protein